MRAAAAFEFLRGYARLECERTSHSACAASMISWSSVEAATPARELLIRVDHTSDGSAREGVAAVTAVVSTG